jgi:hypothetical protein
MNVPKRTPEIKETVKNPNGSIDVFFKDEDLLPINIDVGQTKPIAIKLPTWAAVNTKLRGGTKLSPIEQFVCDNEPAGSEEKKWRKDVKTILKIATNQV